MSYRATYQRIMEDISAKALAVSAVPMSEAEARQLHEHVMRDADWIIGARP